MDEAEVLVGQHFHLQLVAGEEPMQAGQAALCPLATSIYESFGLEAAPFLAERGGGGAGSGHVLRVEAGIADNANLPLDAL